MRRINVLAKGFGPQSIGVQGRCCARRALGLSNAQST